MNGFVADDDDDEGCRCVDVDVLHLTPDMLR
jgi:hypothetical protein